MISAWASTGGPSARNKKPEIGSRSPSQVLEGQEKIVTIHTFRQLDNPDVSVGTYYCGPSISHSHWNHPVSGKLFSMFDLYSGNT